MTQPYSFRPTPLALAVGAALSLSSAPVLSAERAGRVLSAVGPVVARSDDGSQRSLARGDRVYVGDLVRTLRGRTQIRLRDGAMVSLDPRTEFEVEGYETEAQADDGGGSAIMSLFRGALRTITGAIGDEPEETYRMNTPVATVGVRGTEYALAYCEDDSCGSGVPDGLYGHVIDERITVRNEAGRSTFASGTYFHVPDGDTPPERILRPPGELFRGGDREDGGSDIDGPDGLFGDDDDLPGDGEADTAGEPLTDEYSQSTETGGQLLSSAAVAGGAAGTGLGSGTAFGLGGACSSDVGCVAGIDEDGNLTRFGSGAAAIDAGSDASLVESGSVAALDVTWGRWEGDILVDDGSTQTTIDGSFPWAYSTNPTSTTELSNVFSATGTLTFNTVGGPSPVGTINGTAWSVSNLSVAMDIGGGTAIIGDGTFGNNDVDLELTGPANINLITDTNTATIDPSDGDRGFRIDVVDSLGPDSGSVEAVFAGDNAEGLVLEFEAIDDSTGEIVEGVKILNQ